jgi:hypothetical protein
MPIRTATMPKNLIIPSLAALLLASGGNALAWNPFAFTAHVPESATFDTYCQSSTGERMVVIEADELTVSRMDNSLEHKWAANLFYYVNGQWNALDGYLTSSLEPGSGAYSSAPVEVVFGMYQDSTLSYPRLSDAGGKVKVLKLDENTSYKLDCASYVAVKSLNGDAVVDALTANLNMDGEEVDWNKKNINTVPGHN